MLFEFYIININLGFPGGSDSKEYTCNAGDLGLIPGLGRSPGVGHGNLLQYSCLEDPMDEGPGGLHLMESQSWIQLKQLSTHTHAHRAKVTPLLKTFKGHTRKS